MDTNELIAQGLKRSVTLNKASTSSNSEKWLSNKRKFNQYLILGFTTHLKGATRKELIDSAYIAKQLVASYFNSKPMSVFGYRVGVINDISGASVYITFTNLGLPIGQMKIEYIDLGDRADINFIFMKVVTMQEYREQYGKKATVKKKDNKRRWESQTNKLRSNYKSDLTKPAF